MYFVIPQITKQQLQQTKDRFQAFLNGDTQIVADEAFINAVQSYNEVQATGLKLFIVFLPLVCISWITSDSDLKLQITRFDSSNLKMRRRLGRCLLVKLLIFRQEREH